MLARYIQKRTGRIPKTIKLCKWTILAAGIATIAEAASGDVPTIEDAREFVTRFEEFAKEGEFDARIAWLNATHISFDTEWLATRVQAERSKRRVEFANEAKLFNQLDLPSDLDRKISKIKRGVRLPAPSADGAPARISSLALGMRSTYSTAKIELDGEQVGINDLENLMRSTRDPKKLKEIWTKWRDVSTKVNSSGSTIKDDYTALVALANEGAKELGFEDLGAMWRSSYEMAPNEFTTEAERLLAELQPFYEQLHCHVRASLNERYGDASPAEGSIRADLLGNMWANHWGEITELVLPDLSAPAYDITDLLKQAHYTPLKMVEAGEDFYTSLGFDPLPESFWERSQFSEPEGREVECHAQAWSLDGKDDVRIKMCIKINAYDFYTVHHELGHVYYDLAYKDQDRLNRGGANPGFHESIGDLPALSITPDHLKTIGLLQEVPESKDDLAPLMYLALEKVAFMPYALALDTWRWRVFSGEIQPENYNETWWSIRENYQGVKPPVARSEANFDPGTKWHIVISYPYISYFVAHILQFQFHETACKLSGWQGPVHKCSIYGSQDAGERFRDMLEMGASKPWPDALEAFTGSREMDAGAMLRYFAPLIDWLADQNADRQCGW